MANVEFIIKESLGCEYEFIDGECILVDAHDNHYLTRLSFYILSPSGVRLLIVQ